MLIAQIFALLALLATTVRKVPSISVIILALLVTTVHKLQLHQLLVLQVLTMTISSVCQSVTAELVPWDTSVVKQQLIEAQSAKKDTTVLLVQHHNNSLVLKVPMVVIELVNMIWVNACSAQPVIIVVKELLLPLLLIQAIGVL